MSDPTTGETRAHGSRFSLRDYLMGTIALATALGIGTLTGRYVIPAAPNSGSGRNGNLVARDSEGMWGGDYRYMNKVEKVTKLSELPRIIEALEKTLPAVKSADEEVIARFQKNHKITDDDVAFLRKWLRGGATEQALVELKKVRVKVRDDGSSSLASEKDREHLDRGRHYLGIGLIVSYELSAVGETLARGGLKDGYLDPAVFYPLQEADRKARKGILEPDVAYTGTGHDKWHDASSALDNIEPLCTELSTRAGIGGTNINLLKNPIYPVGGKAGGMK